MYSNCYTFIETFYFLVVIRSFLIYTEFCASSLTVGLEYAGDGHSVGSTACMFPAITLLPPSGIKE